MSPGVPGAETLIMSGSIITPDTDTSPDAVTRMLSTGDTITLHTAAVKRERALDTGGHSGHNSLYRVTQQTPGHRCVSHIMCTDTDMHTCHLSY